MTWPYTDFGKPSTVKLALDRPSDAQLGVTTVEFANGTRLSRQEHRRRRRTRVAVQVLLGHGRAGLKPELAHVPSGPWTPFPLGGMGQRSRCRGDAVGADDAASSSTSACASMPPCSSLWSGRHAAGGPRWPRCRCWPPTRGIPASGPSWATSSRPSGTDARASQFESRSPGCRLHARELTRVHERRGDARLAGPPNAG